MNASSSSGTAKTATTTSSSTSNLKLKYRYKYKSYSEINDGLRQLARVYPSLVRIESAQADYGLPSPGTCRSSASIKRPDVPCESLIVRISLDLNRWRKERGIKHAPDTDDDNEAATNTNRDAAGELGGDTASSKPTNLPQMLILGSMHGDEQLGAQISYYLVKLIVDLYDDDPWIGRLVQSRELIIVPIPNPVGYDRVMRLEDAEGQLVDPNSDFPYDAESPEHCMRSIGARLVNELFLRNLFRVALVFHGRKNFIGYSWGDASHCIPSTPVVKSAEVKNKGPAVDGVDSGDDDDEEDDDDELHCKDGWQSPDHTAFSRMAEFMGVFAGRFKGVDYKFGALNDPRLYRPAGGGIVDWGYASSFDPRKVQQCHPDTFDGYPPEKLKYSDATHRCLTFIVETGQQMPPEKELGFAVGLYAHKVKRGNGHIPRNIRLSLLALDLLEPYVFFIENEKGSSADLSRGGILQVKWSVGGALSVAKTYLEIDVVDMNITLTSRSYSGGSMWAPNNGMDGYAKRFSKSQGIFYAFADTANVLKWAFSESISLYKHVPSTIRDAGATLKIRAVAIVDQDWNPNNGSAQSHMSRLRSDPSWRAVNGPIEIQGRSMFFSEHLEVQLPPYSLINAWYNVYWELLVLCVFLFVMVPVMFLLVVLCRSGGSGVSGLASPRFASFGGSAAANVRARLRRAFVNKNANEEAGWIRARHVTPHPAATNARGPSFSFDLIGPAGMGGVNSEL